MIWKAECSISLHVSKRIVKEQDCFILLYKNLYKKGILYNESPTLSLQSNQK